jgi:hypothetical protein
MHKPFYSVQCYEYDAPGFNAIIHCSSRRKASRVFGQLRSKFPGSIVTLNRRQYFGEGVWLTTTHHWKG